MLKWFSNDESGPNQAALESQEGSSSQSMAEVIDQLAQTQQLVSQLKELIREKDSNLKAKDEQLKTEKDSFEAKLSKLKLQNKAKVKSLNAQLEDLKKQLTVSGGKVEIKKSGGDGDQEHVSASLGMILLLKKKTEELELQLLQKEAELTVKTKELEAQRQRGMEMDAMLAENNRRLAEKEAYIIDLQMTVGGDITTQTHEPQVVEKKSAGEPASILELQLLVQHLTKKVEESEERYSLLQEQTESLKESLVNEKAQFEKRENTYKENKDNKLTEINHIHEQELFRLAEKSDASADLEQKDNKLTEINQTHEQELFRLAATSDASADLEQALKQKLHEKEEVLLGKTQVINVLQGEVDAKDQKIKEALQADCKLMEESESEDSSAPEDCDTDEELCYFQDRLDPAVDDLSEDEAGSVSGASVKLDHVTASSPFSKRRRMSPASWNSEEDADVGPSSFMFKPTRPPGVQLSPADRHTPQDLFKMFFSMDAVMTLCRNTNRRAALHIAEGKKYKWTDVSVEEFYRYIGLVFYMAMVKLDHMRDHWRQNTIFSQILPSKVMSRDRFRTISWNVHMSDPDEDPANDQKRGTPQHDRLFRLKPLMTTIQDACKAFYQPRRSLSVDERMVASKAKTEMTQYMKAKPTKWGFKLFVLADSSNGYTVDFSVYTGKNDFRSGQGLSYDSVMSLMNRHYLGCGYHLYMDNFYTSPKLLMDLFSQSVGACGTYRDNRKGCPRPTSNAISKNSARGTFRWIRDGPTVFVKWMDTREVSVCSTIHSAYKGDEVQRRLKSEDGTWTTKTFPCPSPVVEYNTFMGGVDLSDQLIQYYSAQQKSMKWYRKLFLHFLDIAATNAYILHKELSALVQQKPLSHKDFMEELIVQLCGCAKKCPQQSHSEHVPVPVNSAHLDVRKVASYGRRTCMLCRADEKQQSTPWKCQACDVPLCLQLTRNCFQEWHKKL